MWPLHMCLKLKKKNNAINILACHNNYGLLIECSIIEINTLLYYYT